ncbi:MAG: tetratricopeptide repeat protein [Chitinophagales bacterium]|nr:tetratricopeptide repeat protein [Chitinophagales bacterium]
MAIAVVLAYSKIFNAGFMSWDDIDYVFHTPDISSFTAEHLKNMWSEYYIGNYQPLPMMSYALDYLIVGDKPFIYHLTNIVWHIADVILLYACIKKMGGNAYIALFAALLFAVHPVQTESVSWIAARNKVMNGFFFLLAMYIYIDYLLTHKNKRLIWVYIFGLLAYLSKLTAVTLPFALLAVDIWMARPLNGKKIWLEKLPLVLLAIPIGIINLQAQDQVSFLNLHPEFNFGHTIVFAGYAYVQYIINLLVPVRLSVLYPYPTAIGPVHILYTILAIAIVATGVIAYRKKWFTLAGGILFYTVNIAIVLQFVQFGEVLMADRYLYLAGIGVWYPMAFFGYQYFNKNKEKTTKAGLAVIAAMCLIYGGATFMRNDIWLSELNFWQSVTDKFPESSVAQSSLGGVYMNKGENTTAMSYIEEAIKLDENNYKAWYNKGVLMLRKGDAQEALYALNRAIRLNEYSKALFTRALLYQQTGNYNKALPDIEKVLATEPQNARAYYIYGDCIEQQGNLDKALQAYNSAIQYDPNDPLFYLRRGLVQAKTGRNQEAISDMSSAIQIDNKYAEAWYWRGMIKHRSGMMPCDDLNKARNLGLDAATEALTEICNTH